MKGNAMKTGLIKLTNKVPILLTPCMNGNQKLECQSTMSKAHWYQTLYLVNTVYISSLQALYKLICDIKLLCDNITTYYICIDLHIAQYVRLIFL